MAPPFLLCRAFCMENMMSVREKNRRIASNFTASYTWYQAHNPAYTVKRVEDMVCAYASGSLIDFNVAMPFIENGEGAPLPAAEWDFWLRNVEAVQEFFADRASPFSFWAMQQDGEIMPDPGQAGFSHQGVYTGQYLELERLVLKEAEGLDVRRVASRVDIVAFADLIGLGWNMPSAPYREFFVAQEPWLLAKDCVKELYIGWSGGQAACCMELFVQPEEKVGGVYYVTTHKDFRRRGLAAALQSGVLDGARRRGFSGATVVSEPDECRLLRSIGFVDCALWYEYVCEG